jgi:Predicted phosphohydrolases
MRILLVSLILPLLAFVLWWPLSALPRAVRWRRIGLSLLVALLLPAMVVVWRSDMLGYAAISWLQVGAGGLVLLGMLLLVFVIMRTAGWAVHALLERLLRRTPGIGLRRWHAPWLTQGAVVVAALAAVLGIGNGLAVPQVRESALLIEQLPAELDGLRIAVLADLHLTPVKGRARSEEIVRRTLAARPDLIVLPGDMVDGPVAVSGPMVAPLAGLQAPLGVWLAPGNHEVYHDYADWMAFFGQLGLPVLENRAVSLEHNGVRFTVSGLGDLAARRAGAWGSGIPNPTWKRRCAGAGRFALPPDAGASAEAGTRGCRQWPGGPAVFRAHPWRPHHRHGPLAGGPGQPRLRPRRVPAAGHAPVRQRRCRAMGRLQRPPRGAGAD